MVALQLLGWAGSALLVFSVLQTRILRLRIFGGVASAVLVIFNAAIAVWPMVAMNVVLTAINVFYIVRLLRTRHDPETFDVVEISPQEKYVRYLLNQFAADIQRFNPGFSADNAARADHGFLVLRGAETVVWSWPETPATPPPTSTWTTWCRGIKVSHSGSSSTAPTVPWPRSDTTEPSHPKG